MLRVLLVFFLVLFYLRVGSLEGGSSFGGGSGFRVGVCLGLGWFLVGF